MSQRSDGNSRTFDAGEALDKYLLVDLDGSGDAVANGAGNAPIGSTEYSQESGRPIAVLLRNAPGTRILTASGTIADGADVYPAASGKVSATVSGSAFGQAIQGGADGDYIEVLPY